MAVEKNITLLKQVVSPFLLFVGMQLCNIYAYAQSVLDVCENGVPKTWVATSNGSLSLDATFAKIGNHSIKWEWHKGGALQITDADLQRIKDDPNSMMTFWINNTTALNDGLIFAFEKNGRLLDSFSFGLNFEGWRAGWLLHHRDLKNVWKENPDRLVIYAPKSAPSGELYFDHLQVSIHGDPRSPIPDAQMPFVQKDVLRSPNAHWCALYPFSQYLHSISWKGRSMQSASDAMMKIMARMDSMLLNTDLAPKALTPLSNRYRAYQIKNVHAQYVGLPIFTPQQMEVVEGLTDAVKKQWFDKRDIKKFHTLLLDIAIAYRKSSVTQEKDSLSNMFIHLLDHMNAQGWAYGSGQGVLHHIGYNFKDFFPACFLMRDVLKERKLLERTYKTMYWYVGLGRTRVDATKAAKSNIDVFNTLAPGMLYTVFMVPDPEERVVTLKEFSNWLSYSLYPTYSLDGTFKPDGAVFHHENLYPAYGIGGFSGLAPLVFALSRTDFQIDKKAFETLRKAMYMMAIYSEHNRWPISVSGRHPNGEWEIDTKSFGFMALSNPLGNTDTTMASIFLRTSYKKTEKSLRDLVKQTIHATPYIYPQGHWSVNYGLLEMHRGNDWLLTVRGHNRYFVANESYPGANVFGRYISYGHLEILYPSATHKLNSGFADKGWDWSHLPGTTAPYLSLDSLRARIINADAYSGVEEMLLTDEVFAGGMHWQQKQGLFAMKLHGHDKYDQGDFHAIKSWFMFDSLVVCLGSNIRSSNKYVPIHTTVYQEALDSALQVAPVTNSSVDHATQCSSRGIAYDFPEGQERVLIRGLRNSRDQKDAIATSGPIEQLYIDHGVAPNHAQYEYAILVPTHPSTVSNQRNEMPSPTKAYEVIHKDSLAHVVHYLPKDLIAAAVFQPSTWHFDHTLAAVSTPCLLMYHQEKDTLELNVSDPDMHFYEGKEDVPLDASGKRKEVSIYSRKWITSTPRRGKVVLTLKGAWKLQHATETLRITTKGNMETMIAVTCKNGATTALKLIKLK